ncbi:hypothetical protein [Actinocorallia populi]|uniref:hypothetical protein n=1 Tax=Actinocorallia populi TaxID=2079200 RepID=UPI000D093FB6|nr:hypothetical protein [Actinocorallia populi]
MSMRSGPASRDPNFRGIDPAALGQVVQQLQRAAGDIEQWLRANPAPAGVSAAGYQQARAVQQWVTDQLGMLTRRRSLALAQREEPDVNAPPSPELGRDTRPTAPDENDTNAFTEANGQTPGNTVNPAPAAPAGENDDRPPQATPVGSGDGGAGQEDQPVIKPVENDVPAEPAVPPGSGSDLGGFASTGEAVKVAVTDAYATSTAFQGGTPVTTGVWKNLTAHAKDPEYTAAYYERLGPEGVAKLIDAAEGDKARLDAITQSIATANNQFHMDSQWVAALLGEADKLGNRAEVLQVLQSTPLAPRLDDVVTVAGPAKLTTAAKVS